MMGEQNSDLQAKINRAIRAVLIDQGAGGVGDTYAAITSEGRTLPNTTITTGDGVSFDGPGNWYFPSILLNLRDSGLVQPNEPNPAAPRMSANDRMTGIYNALCRSDDEHTLDFTAKELTRLGRLLAVDQSGGTDPDQVKNALANADMVDFTVLYWQSGLMGTPKKHDEKATFWERELEFSCIACNAALAA
jgi:hypothetical protein